MELKELMFESIEDIDLTAGHGKLKINPIQRVGGLEAFNYLNSEAKEVKIGDNIDFLALFMRMAEHAYLKDKDSFGTYIVASNIGGGNIFWGEFTEEQKKKFQYGFIYLASVLKGKVEGIETKISFWAEISLVDSREEDFRNSSQKVLKVLKNDNREVWMNIAEKQLSFIKTDMRILELPKLHSWGFQAISVEGIPEPNFNYVRSKGPKPRGESRK